jgi:hypothetical protein
VRWHVWWLLRDVMRRARRICWGSLLHGDVSLGLLWHGLWLKLACADIIKDDGAVK